MHHVTIDDWSRGSSFLHRRDARAKLVSLLALLVALSTSGRNHAVPSAVILVLLVLTSYRARLPLLGFFKKSVVVLPFCAVFAISSWLAGDRAGAMLLILRSYVSGYAALLFVSTTPLPKLLRGLEQLRAPRFLLAVMQFLYRYLFLLSEEAQHTRVAALSRGGFKGRTGFAAAGGALGVLFARSHERAGHIHSAMLSRGYNGTLPVSESAPLGISDFLVPSVCLAFSAMLIFGASS